MQRRPLVLVTDDDADTRDLYQLSLSLDGFCVEVASDGLEAWEKVQTLLPHVVVTDITLPLLDGAALCQRIHDDHRTAHISVIAVTGWAGKAADYKMGEAGFRACLLKPVPLDALVSELRKAVEESRTLRESAESACVQASRTVLKPKRIMVSSACHDCSRG